MQKANSVDPQQVAAVLPTLKVAEVPHLIIQYRPYENGLLFKDGQANPPSSAQVWQGQGWHNMPGDHVEVTTAN